jgi:hypothetical protein
MQALKELYSMLSDQVDEFATELRMLSKLHHEYIVPFYGLYRVASSGT